ncbi:hypothetical protein JYU14_03230 [Simkania negevensis]|uniref:Long-chain-fatty-acyl-CoA reductase n=1 Tax=Simkania negevensis TaxID=83561 RepID=A0ABS3AQR8_9BACT|nr:hypothetical protein [Simkania negevensis]
MVITDDALERDIAAFVSNENRLQTFSYREIRDALHSLSVALSSRRHPLYEQYRPLGLAFLLSFLSSCNLDKLVKFSLRSLEAIDRIVSIEGTRCCCIPRGVVGHWIAGNVPLLGLLSLIQAMLTKNRSIVKISSRQKDYISPVLDALATVSDVGRALASSVKVVQFSGSEQEANLAMAEACTVRIAWGGEEAVRSIKALPSYSDDVETVVFGPKLSVAVIDHALMNEERYDKLVADVILFNQNICSSPHTLFVKGDKKALLRVTICIKEAFDRATTSPDFPKSEPHEAIDILTYRALQWMEGEALHASKGTEWTIHTHDQLGLLSWQGARTLQLYSVKDWAVPLRYLPHNLQTVSHCLNRHDLDELINLWKYSGVTRFPRIGNAHHYTQPWDGVILLDRLVKWLYIEDQ